MTPGLFRPVISLSVTNTRLFYHIMDLSNLKPAVGSTTRETRIGRGPGSGKGGTSTRGHKGAKSRSGYSRKIGFEGGQMPLQRRLPKFGFKNFNRVEYRVVNLDALEALAEAKNLEKIGLDELRAAGVVGKRDLVKVLGNGSVTRKLAVEANAFDEIHSDFKKHLDDSGVASASHHHGSVSAGLSFGLLCGSAGHQPQ